MSTRKNCHWTEDDARQVLARGEREGKSITALAREQGVSPQRLYWWKKRLRGEEPSPSSFVEVSIRAARQAQPFAVQTRNGRTWRCGPGSMRRSWRACWPWWRTRNAEPATSGARVRGAGADRYAQLCRVQRYAELNLRAHAVRQSPARFAGRWL